MIFTDKAEILSPNTDGTCFPACVGLGVTKQGIQATDMGLCWFTTTMARSFCQSGNPVQKVQMCIKCRGILTLGEWLGQPLLRWISFYCWDSTSSTFLWGSWSQGNAGNGSNSLCFLVRTCHTFRYRTVLHRLSGG